MTKREGITVLIVALVALSMTVTTGAEPGPISALAKAETFQKFSRAWEEVGGDRNVVVRLDSSRAFVTERISARGYARLDLIDGKAAVELWDLDRAVDVWLVDNKPGLGKTILPEKGDRVIHLARLAPTAGDSPANVKHDLGPEAFRGVEVDWILVSEADADPARSRLLYGTRTYFESAYTRERLAREGFVEPRPRKLTRPNPTKVVSPTPAPVPVVAAVPHEILVKTGLVSQEVFDGGNSFFRETFEGNGRTCGTCHPVENNQTIDKEFIATLPASDPLFIAEQVPYGHPIQDLERPELMREFGLILENVDGLEDPNVKFLMRSVPHSLSTSTSVLAPTPSGIFEERTGWSGDGAPTDSDPTMAPNGTLRDFLLGAIIQHYPKNSLDRVFKEDVPPGDPFDFRMPTDDELDDTLAFMLEVGRTNEIDLTTITLSNANAQSGKEDFRTSACNSCHNNAGANFVGGVNGNLNTNVEKLVNPAQGFMGIFFPLDGGFGGQGLSAPNFDCDMDGTLDCFGDGTFNVPPLIEAADTAPFFHNNAVLDVEGSVRFYTQPPFPEIFFTDEQIDNVAAFMRVINACFNLDLSIQRNEAALTIDPHAETTSSVAEHKAIRGTANRLLQLANVEIVDAVGVLSGGPLAVLNPAAVNAANRAASLNRKAVNETDFNERKRLMEEALEELEAAKSDLGTGIDFDLGEGNLIF